MATLEARIISLAQAIGVDVKDIRTSIGVLSGLSTTAKNNLVAAINELVASQSTANGKIGDLSTLTTSATTSLVAAINELQAEILAIDATDLIDDAAVAGVTDKTYSVDKIVNLLAALKTDILGGIPDSTLDTIKELADYLADSSVAGGLVEQLGNRVRVDAAQTFTAPQQEQARTNISAASIASVTAVSTAATTAQAEIDALELAVGNTDHDYVADYNVAKA